MPYTGSNRAKEAIPNFGGSFGVHLGDEVILNSLNSGACATNLIQLAQVTLTSAQIIAMNGTPVTLIAAPTAGGIVVDYVVFNFTAGGTAFTGGGTVTIGYAGGSAVVNTFASSIITSASSSETLLVTGSSNITVSPTTAITITNATGAFAAGNGSAVVSIWYSIV